MNIATIYTLYNRRAGAELCFEKIIKATYDYNTNIKWIVYCNKQAENVLKKYYPFAETIYIPYLDNQYKKAFWLEFLSKKDIAFQNIDCFWNPSGCNHFPGHWNVPVLTTFHDLGEYHIKNKYSFARTVFRKKICIPRSQKRSKAFTAVSEFTAKDMQHFLNIPLEHTSIIYNGNSPHYSSIVSEQNSTLIAKWGLERKQYLFTPGRTDYIGKGLDILLKSFREIHVTNPTLKLALAGPKGEGHDSLMKILSKDKYIASHILYLGRVDDDELISLYSNCLETVIPSRFEGFGFPILEAMMHNVPIICSNAGSLPEVAGDAALVFKSGNSSDLSNSINKMLKLDNSQIETLKARGKKQLQKFTWEKCAQQMLEALQSVCEKKSTIE